MLNESWSDMSNGRIRILALVALISAAVALVLTFAPATVRAALWLTFDPPSAPPGSTIAVRTGGTGALGLMNVGDALPLYLVLEDSAGGLLQLGTLTVDAGHDGTGTFIVPDVAPGKHGVMVRCEPCAEFSNGRSLLPMGVFTVLSGVPSTSTGDVAPPQAPPLSALDLAAGMVAIAVLLLFWPRLDRKH